MSLSGVFIGRSAVTKNTVVVLITIGILVVPVAFGHARLKNSSPASHAELSESPRTLTLIFDEKVQLAMLKLKSASKEVSVTVDHTTQAAQTITVNLPALSPDTYEVQWSAMSDDDGHVIKGVFTFSILSHPK
jgi:methionine-rich copper-binding protein CopC